MQKSAILASAAALVLGVFGLGAQVASRHQQAEQLLTAATDASAAPELASFKILEPSWVYYGRRPIRELRGKPAEATEFLAGSPDRFLITTADLWSAISQGKDVGEITVLAEVDYFLQGERLVLVGHPTPRVARQPSGNR